jgi:hypothetical protein
MALPNTQQDLVFSSISNTRRILPINGLDIDNKVIWCRDLGYTLVVTFMKGANHGLLPPSP